MTVLGPLFLDFDEVIDVGEDEEVESSILLNILLINLNHFFTF
jgi:hypothetical protein